MARELSVRETEELVRKLQANEVPATKSVRPMDPDILHLQNNLSKQLKMKVAIKCNAKGRGKLIIHYRNLSELDELLAQFQQES